ncbi:MAG: hypothetical protein VKJ04_08125 [Vampirovibrionales bacterium]|nr:hypothetical protein [Vampirovibrionales bacterium]
MGTSPINPYLPVTYSPYGPAIRGAEPAMQNGQYGLNAHQNYLQAQKQALGQLDQPSASSFQRTQPLALLSTATIRYNPETSNSGDALVANAYGYAKADIASLGGDDSLNRTHLVNHFGLEAADKFMKAEDLNFDGTIDSKEHTAYILFSDNAPRFMSDTLTAYAQNPNGIAGLNPNVLLEWSDQFASMAPSRLDGQITAGERTGAEQAVTLAPNFAREAIKGIYNTVDIPGKLANQPLATPGQTPPQPQPSANPFQS